jgi:hypothetical protein
MARTVRLAPFYSILFRMVPSLRAAFVMLRRGLSMERTVWFKLETADTKSRAQRDVRGGEIHGTCKSIKYCM